MLLIECLLFTGIPFLLGILLASLHYRRKLGWYERHLLWTRDRGAQITERQVKYTEYPCRPFSARA